MADERQMKELREALATKQVDIDTLRAPWIANIVGHDGVVETQYPVTREQALELERAGANVG